MEWYFRRWPIEPSDVTGNPVTSGGWERHSMAVVFVIDRDAIALAERKITELKEQIDASRDLSVWLALDVGHSETKSSPRPSRLDERAHRSCCARRRSSGVMR